MVGVARPCAAPAAHGGDPLLARDRAGQGGLVGHVVHGAGEFGVPLGAGERPDDGGGGELVVGVLRDDQVGAAGEDGAGPPGRAAGHREEPEFVLQARVPLEDRPGESGYGDDLCDLAVGEHPSLGRVFLVGVDGPPAQRLEAPVEVHAAQRGGGVQGAPPLVVLLLGEVTALVPDEAGERVPVLPGEVDALVAVGVELLGVGEPFLAGPGRAGDAGLLEQVLAVDDDPAGRVPGDAVLLVAVLAGLGEAGQPRVLAPVPHGLQREVHEPAALGVQRNLGVADLDDVRGVAGVRRESGADLLHDAGPLLDADVEAQVVVGALEVLGEPLDEVLGGAVLHQPYGDGPALVVAGEHPAAGDEGAGDADEGEQTTSHEGSCSVWQGCWDRGWGPGVGERARGSYGCAGILVWTNAEVKRSGPRTR
ncbi:hypothetical protein GCM10017687_24890 [Streptomyces echinatus]